MLQKLNSRRGGFTLVEIMIVVAIIALLATIAVPNFLRARLRSQATACKQDLRMLDAALEQYAIENNKQGSSKVTFNDLKPYIKENSPLYYSGGNDTLGNKITLSDITTGVKVPTATANAVADVIDTTFFSPYLPAN
ncbi:MAG: prepilin-type N-terminal cleavage/methylation domain-containing protein [Verrucomicrobiota bacterium]